MKHIDLTDQELYTLHDSIRMRGQALEKELPEQCAVEGTTAHQTLTNFQTIAQKLLDAA